MTAPWLLLSVAGDKPWRRLDIESAFCVHLGNRDLRDVDFFQVHFPADLVHPSSQIEVQCIDDKLHLRVQSQETFHLLFHAG